jgi:hypothetical protein
MMIESESTSEGDSDNFGSEDEEETHAIADDVALDQTSKLLHQLKEASAVPG